MLKKTLVAAILGGLLVAGLAAADDRPLVLDEVVVVEGNKPSVEALVAEATISNMELSPNGKYVAGVRRDGRNYFLIVADVTQPEITFTGTRFEDLRITDVNWATDDRLIISAVALFDSTSRSLLKQDDWYDPDVRQFGVPALYGIDRDGGNLIRFFEGDRKKDNIFTRVELLSVAPEDPDNMLISVRRPEINNRLSGGIELGGADVYKVNIYSGDDELLNRGATRTQGYEVDYRGNLKYRIDENSAGSKSIYYTATYKDNGEIDWKRGAEIDIADLRDQLVEDFTLQLIAPAEEAPLFYARDVAKGDDRFAIWLYNIETGEHVEKVAEHPSFDMGGGDDRLTEGVIFEPNTGELIGVSWSGEKPDMYMFDPDRQKHVEALYQYLGDQKNLRILDMSADGKTWLIFVSGPGHPGYYAIYELDKVKVTEIAVRSAALAGKATYPVEIMRYKARDGKELFAYVTLPEGAGSEPKPWVMFPHGGPQARDYFRFDDLTQMMASRGYVVIQPQFRGSDGLGLNFALAGYREWGGLMQEDVEDAEKALIDSGLIDPERGCIGGFSYGGYAAMMGAVKTPDAYRCVIAGGGVYDLREMQKWSRNVRGSNSPTYKYWIRQLGDENANFDDLIARSPARNVDKLKAPVFLFHGARDDIVPIEQAEILKGRLESAGAEFEYVVMEKAGHEFGAYRTDEPVDVRKQILAFLAKHNPTPQNR